MLNKSIILVEIWCQKRSIQKVKPASLLEEGLREVTNKELKTRQEQSPSSFHHEQCSLFSREEVDSNPHF